MSSPVSIRALIAGAAILATGCASNTTTDKAASANSETETQSEPAPNAPAPADARKKAGRLPPLERANFWAQEYSKQPDDLETTLKFCAALRDIGSHKRAAQVASQASVLHPESTDLMHVLGRALMQQGRLEEAGQALSRAVSLDANNADALATLGLVNDRMGQHASAQAAYRQALELEPDRAKTLSNYGLSLALSGKPQKAEEKLRAAVALPGATTHMRQNLALVLGLQGRYQEMLGVDAKAPDAVMQRNADLLRQLRGETPEPAEPKPSASAEAGAGPDTPGHHERSGAKPASSSTKPSAPPRAKLALRGALDEED